MIHDTIILGAGWQASAGARPPGDGTICRSITELNP
jgi:hypothetical protein